MKKLRYLILALTLLVMSFGSNAQGRFEVMKTTPCTKLVRCTKLDSAQHDLEAYEIVKQELLAWQNLNSLKDAKITDQANTIFELYAQIEEFKESEKNKDKEIILLKEKVRRRGNQRIYGIGLGYVLGKIF